MSTIRKVVQIGRPSILQFELPDRTSVFEVRWHDCITVKQERGFATKEEAEAFAQEVRLGKHSLLEYYGTGSLRGEMWSD